MIYQKPDGKRDGNVVSMYEVMAIRKRNKLPIIDKNCGDGNEFIMALATNEMVLIDDENFKTANINWHSPDHTLLSKYLYRVQVITQAQITFRHHLAAVLTDKEGNQMGRLLKNPNSFKGIKVIINAIGEIRKA